MVRRIEWYYDIIFDNIDFGFSDGSVMRTCAKVSLNDCKQANGVTYCYCKNELCNNPSRKLDSHVSGVASNHEPANLGLQIHHVDPSRGTYIWLLVCFFLG